MIADKHGVRVVVHLICMVLLLTGCAGIELAGRTDSRTDFVSTSSGPTGYASPHFLSKPYEYSSRVLSPTTYIDDTTRSRVSLDGEWKLGIDPNDVGIDEKWYLPESNSVFDQTINVPGFFREPSTIAWYRRTFVLSEETTNRPLRIHFMGAFRDTRVWINGEYVGGFDLPYVPFEFLISDFVKPDRENVIVVRTDNRLTETSLPATTAHHDEGHGWWPYGGITRPVYLEVSSDFLVQRALITPTSRSHIVIDLGGIFLEPASANLIGMVTDPLSRVVGSFERKLKSGTPGQNASIVAEIPIEDPMLWSPDRPDAFYTLKLTIVTDNKEAGAETNRYEFGIRAFKAEADGLFFNDEPIILAGINRHEDTPGLGPVYDSDIISRDIDAIEEIGAKFVRPGHYPNDPRLIVDFQKSGLLIAEEIPVYQLSLEQQRSEELIARSREMLERMIVRDYNRPAIIMWSLANELLFWGKSSERFMTLLHDTARAIDPVRPTIAVKLCLPYILEVLLVDSSSYISDVTGLNLYHGWYFGRTGNLPSYLDRLHEEAPEQPFIVTEFGAGALFGRSLEIGSTAREEPVRRHSYSEAYQRWFISEHMRHYLEAEHIYGYMPWILADFPYQWTPNTGKPHPVANLNLKGLMSRDREKKQAFYVLEKLYDYIYE